ARSAPHLAEADAVTLDAEADLLPGGAAAEERRGDETVEEDQVLGERLADVVRRGALLPLRRAQPIDVLGEFVLVLLERLLAVAKEVELVGDHRRLGAPLPRLALRDRRPDRGHRVGEA